MGSEVGGDDLLPDTVCPKERPEGGLDGEVVVQRAERVEEGEKVESEGLYDSEELDDERHEGRRHEAMDGLRSCLVDLRTDGKSVGGDEERGAVVDRSGELLSNEFRSSTSRGGEVDGDEDVELRGGEGVKEGSGVRKVELGFERIRGI